MPSYTRDPLSGTDWGDFAAIHPKSSAFHQSGWLKALALTYGFRPIVLTNAPPGKTLSDGIVFCEVQSWITGKRLVSLPFADHVEPLVDDGADTTVLTDWMQAQCDRHNWKYCELRPFSWKVKPGSFLAASEAFCFHTLSLEPSTERLFSGLHKSCFQRRIRRAEHEQLSYEKGRSSVLISEFYRLLMITRRRHQLPPQPRAWFQNLVACMSPNVEIRLVRKDGRPLAAILTLSHRGTVVYKYGCSDERFHRLGVMPFLFWKLIEESKAAGFEQIDLGRTDLDNDGLIEFKDRLGATSSQITYLRYPQRANKSSAVATYLPLMRHLFSVLPNSLSSMAGRILYRHVG